MAQITLYHNPRCSKSRSVLNLLEERGVALSVVHYLETPPSYADLEQLAKRLGLSPREWIRKGEAAYREAGLSADSSDEELMRAMAKYPILIERPIAVRDDQALVGRPPERVLELL